MKTNHCVWPADSTAGNGSKLAHVQHVASCQYGLYRASSNMWLDKQTKMKKHRHLKLKAIEVVPSPKAGHVMVLGAVFL